MPLGSPPLLLHVGHLVDRLRPRYLILLSLLLPLIRREHHSKFLPALRSCCYEAESMLQLLEGTSKSARLYVLLLCCSSSRYMSS